MDDFHRRYSAAMRELHGVGIKRSLFGRVWDRALHKAGVRLRPPQYRSFWRETAISAGFWVCGWGGGMYLFAWQDDPLFTAEPVRAALLAVAMSLVSGGIFGLAMALMLRRDRRRHSLTAWHDL